MKHSELRARLNDYLEGDLGLAERARVEAHLAECAACAAEARELRQTVSLVRGLPDPEVPVRLADAVIERLAAGEERPLRWLGALRRLAEPRLAGALAAGAAVLVLALTLDVFPVRDGGPASDSSLGQFAGRGAPDLVTGSRSVRGGRAPALLHPSATWVRGAPGREQRRALRARAVVLRRAPGAPIPVYLSRANPGASLPNLDGEISRLLEAPFAFLNDVWWLSEDGRRARLTLLADHVALQGRTGEVADELRATAHPLADTVAAAFEGRAEAVGER